jgi:hypothetical protein
MISPSVAADQRSAARATSATGTFVWACELRSPEGEHAERVASSSASSFMLR